MSTNYYFRSKEDIRFKIKLDNLLNSFRKDINNFVHLNEDYSRIEDIEEKLREITNEYRWDINSDIEICTTTANKLIFNSSYYSDINGIKEFHDIDGIKAFYDSGNYYLINEYDDVFTWEEFLSKIEYDPTMNYKWI